MSILTEAEKLINGDRQETYGSPLVMGKKIALGWCEILGCTNISPEQVNLAMIWLKMCREIHKPKIDNLVDIAGYAGVIEKIKTEKEDVSVQPAGVDVTGGALGRSIDLTGGTIGHGGIDVTYNGKEFKPLSDSTERYIVTEEVCRCGVSQVTNKISGPQVKPKDSPLPYDYWCTLCFRYYDTVTEKFIYHVDETEGES